MGTLKKPFSWLYRQYKVCLPKLVGDNTNKGTDPATNQPWKVFNSNPPNPLSTKAAKNVFWPEMYDTDRINEEMALAYHNIEITTEQVTMNTLEQPTYLHIGKASDGHFINIAFFNGNYQKGKLVTINPKYF